MTVSTRDRADRLPVGSDESAYVSVQFEAAGWALLAAVGRLLRLTLGAAWRLLLAVELGILIAIILLGAVPLYANLAANVQIQSALWGSGPNQRNVELVAVSTYVASSLQQQEDLAVRPLEPHELAGFTQPGVVSQSLVADTIALATIAGRPAPLLPGGTPADQVTFMAYYNWAQVLPHMQLLAGAVPQPLPSGSTAPPQALITEQMASQLNLHLGDTLTTVSRVSVSAPAGVQVSVAVAGIWQPKDPNDNYWNGQGFLANPLNVPNVPYVYPVLLDPSDFLATLSSFPREGMQQQWTYFTVPTHISTANTADVVERVGALRTSSGNVSVSGMRRLDVDTGLDTLVSGVMDTLSLLQLPLYAVAFLVVGLALLFVVNMGSVVVEAQRGQVAVLRSRGASGPQVLAVYALLGLLLGAVGAALGLWLAAALATTWVTQVVPASTLTAAHISSTYLRGLAQPVTALVPAVAGGLLGAVALVLAGWQAARLDVLQTRREQGRVARPPFWRRYFLDLLLVAVAVLAFDQLIQFGTLGSREAAGTAARNLLLVATPGLMVLAGALLLLRAFPAYVALGLRASGGRRGPVGVLAFARLARGRSTMSRVGLLLAVALALSLFGLTFSATLEQSAADRAAYATGADLQVVLGGTVAGTVERNDEAALRALPGVRRFTPVYRAGVTTSDATGDQPLSLLAIDPATWGTVAGSTSWRSDYASEPLATLMAGLQAHQWHIAPSASGQPGDQSHPVWALVSTELADVLQLKLGQTFVLNVNQATNPNTAFQVGAIVRDFPTLYPNQAPGGFLVIGLPDAEAIPSSPPTGPNEYWVQTSSVPAQHAALLRALDVNGGTIGIINTTDRETLHTAIANDPLQAGMRGLLLGGAVVAVLLALLGTLVEVVVALRQRTVEVAILRTLGTSPRQVVRMVLTEHAAVYGFGVLGGVLLGGLLVTEALPYLQFTDALNTQATAGTPPALLVINPLLLAALCAVIGGALAGSLLITWVSTSRSALGRLMRMGED